MDLDIDVVPSQKHRVFYPFITETTPIPLRLIASETRDILVRISVNFYYYGRIDIHQMKKHSSHTDSVKRAETRDRRQSKPERQHCRTSHATFYPTNSLSVSCKNKNLSTDRLIFSYGKFRRNIEISKDAFVKEASYVRRYKKRS